MGDFNGIGKRKNVENTIMGHSHLGCRNSRGQKSIHFAMVYQLKITNTFFTKHAKRKCTWKSPAGRKNEIDFILANNIKCITNIEVPNKLDFITDHRLVRATIVIDQKQFRKKLF